MRVWYIRDSSSGRRSFFVKYNRPGLAGCLWAFALLMKLGLRYPIICLQTFGDGSPGADRMYRRGKSWNEKTSLGEFAYC